MSFSLNESEHPNKTQNVFSPLFLTYLIARNDQEFGEWTNYLNKGSVGSTMELFLYILLSEGKAITSDIAVLHAPAIRQRSSPPPPRPFLDPFDVLYKLT